MQYRNLVRNVSTSAATADSLRARTASHRNRHTVSRYSRRRHTTAERADPRPPTQQQVNRAREVLERYTPTNTVTGLTRESVATRDSYHGAITAARKDGQWVARCRVRDLDGVTREVERWGSSRTAAQRALQDELRQRRGERTELLRPNSRFREAAAIWMGKIRERREDSTVDTYRHSSNASIRVPNQGVCW